MFAVFESGGKQHRVVEGERIRLEKLDVAPGQSVEFDRVMLIADGDDVKLGKPYVEGGRVTAEVVEHGRGDKIRILKFKRRKGYTRRQGHRQSYTEVQITAISNA